MRFFVPSSFLTPRQLKNLSLDYEPTVFARHALLPQEKNYRLHQWGKDLNYRINTHGYRGKNFDIKKPAGTIRIMVFGGSTAFDLMVNDPNDWPHRVEENLRALGIDNVEVINAGIPMHASYDCVGRLFAEGHLFKPDYVLLYNSWNDIKRFSDDRPLLRSLKPYSANENPFLNYKNPADEFLSEHSHLYSSIRYTYLSKKFPHGMEGLVPEKIDAPRLSENAIAQYKLNLETFIDITRNIKATPILMTEGRLITKDNAATEKEKLKFAYDYLPHEFIAEAFLTADQIIEAVAKEKNADMIDASKTLTGRTEFFDDHVHLNDHGSQTLANLVTEYFKDSFKKTSHE